MRNCLERCRIGNVLLENPVNQHAVAMSILCLDDFDRFDWNANRGELGLRLFRNHPSRNLRNQAMTRSLETSSRRDLKSKDKLPA